MGEWSAPQIRELIEQGIRAERCLRDRLRVEDRERFEEYKKTAAHALQLQATEYERRLDVLNHAHAEAQRILHTYVSQSVYDKDIERLTKLEKTVDIALAERTGISKGVIQLFTVLSGVAFVISVTVAILNYGK